MQMQREQEMLEERKYREEVQARIRRNDKLKAQLEKWEKDKEDKQQQVLQQMHIQQQKQKAIQEQIRKDRLAQKQKLELYHAEKDEEAKRKEEWRIQQKQKFLHDYSMK